MKNVNTDSHIKSGVCMSNKYTNSIWLSILVGAIASTLYIYDYIVRVMPAAMSSDLMASFHIAASGFGLLASLFFWGYALMQIPVGLLCDRYSPRFLLAINTLIAALATALFSTTHHYSLALVCRFMMGITTSFAYIGALKIGANWFPAKRFAMYAGLVQFLGCMGAILGETPIVLLTNQYGWRQAGIYIALLGVLFSILIWFIVRNTPNKDHHAPLKQASKVKQPQVKLFSNKQTWWIAAFGFTIWAPVVALATTWGIQFFQTFYAISKTSAADLIDFIWLGIALGGPLIGWYSDKIHRRKVPIYLAAIIGFVCACLLIYTHIKIKALLIILLFLYGVASSSMVLSFGLISDIHKKHAIGTASGFINMAVIFSGVIILPIIGFILKLLWQGHVLKGIHIYTTHSYQMALSIIPCAYFLALIITLFFIRETHCGIKA